MWKKIQSLKQKNIKIFEDVIMYITVVDGYFISVGVLITYYICDVHIMFRCKVIKSWKCMWNGDYITYVLDIIPDIYYATMYLILISM